MTYRERREARAARLRGWAEGREVKAEAGFARAHELADAIPFGQPILAGHHSQGRDERYRGRIVGTMDRAVADSRKASEMSARADEIDRQAAHAIYSDDVDAAGRLREKIARLEAERDRYKAFNRSCRANACDFSLLDEAQRRNHDSCHNAQQTRTGGAFPAYVTSNLGATIRQAKQRLAALGGAA